MQTKPKHRLEREALRKFGTTTSKKARKHIYGAKLEKENEEN